MKNWTPGPWRITQEVDRGEDLSGTDIYYGIAAGSRTEHANEGHFHPDDAIYFDDEVDIVEVSFDRETYSPEGGIRSAANAMLISKGPDLAEYVRRKAEAGDQEAVQLYNSLDSRG